jgi:hypothetical protein
MLFSCIPGVKIKLNDKLAIDINIPLGIYDIRLVRTKNDNPLLPVEDRKNMEFEDNLIPDFVHVRLGICYNIN